MRAGEVTANGCKKLSKSLRRLTRAPTPLPRCPRARQAQRSLQANQKPVAARRGPSCLPHPPTSRRCFSAANSRSRRSHSDANSFSAALASRTCTGARVVLVHEGRPGMRAGYSGTGGERWRDAKPVAAAAGAAGAGARPHRCLGSAGGGPQALNLLLRGVEAARGKGSRRREEEVWAQTQALRLHVLLRSAHGCMPPSAPFSVPPPRLLTAPPPPS